MEWEFLFGLSAITLAVIGLLIYLGRKLSGAAERHAAEIDLPLYVTPVGTALSACLVAFWLACATIRALRPESVIGDFLKGPEGLVAVLTGSVFATAIAAAILQSLGYPIARKTRDR